MDRAEKSVLCEGLISIENRFGIAEDDGRDRVVGLRKYLLVGLENYV